MCLVILSTFGVNPAENGPSMESNSSKRSIAEFYFVIACLAQLGGGWTPQQAEQPCRLPASRLAISASG